MSNLSEKSSHWLCDAIYDSTKFFEGVLLTIIDGAFSDPIQRKAVKDQIHRAVWEGNGELNSIISRHAEFLRGALKESPTPPSSEVATIKNPFLEE